MGTSNGGHGAGTSRTAGGLAALLAAALLVTAGLVGGASAVARPAASTPVAVAPPGAASVPADGPAGRDDRVDLADDMVAPSTGGALQRWRPRRWPGRTIRYHESIPAKWDWSLDRAIERWNRSGGRIRFVEVPRSKARLTIRYGDTGGADGVGTLGYQAVNYVHLSPRYKRADAQRAETRVWVGRLFAHELGHVLGFDHTGGRCSLMYPVFDMGGCPLLSTTPGSYECRWIDKPLLRRFVAWYGGRARLAPRRCLIEPLPAPLRDVTFSGGQLADAPVRVTWRPPAGARPGTKVFVTVWQAASCGAMPETWDLRVGLAPSTGTWTDPRYGDGPWCFGVEVANRYGGARPAEVRRIERWAPVPGAPAVGPPTWIASESAWSFSWSAPRGVHLAVVRGWEDPTTCPTSTADWFPVDRRPSGTWSLSAYHAAECVLLVATTDWGTVSAPTAVVLSVPPPTVRPTVGDLTYDPELGTASAVVDLAEDAGTLGIHVLAGSCPAAAPAGATWWDGFPQGDGTWSVYPVAASGPHCALFAALDGFGQPGPVVAREFLVP